MSNRPNNSKRDPATQKKERGFQFGIQEINLLESQIDPLLPADYSTYGKKLQYKLEVNIFPQSSKKIVQIIVDYSFNSDEHTLFKFKTENIFKIEDVSDIYSNETLNKKLAAYLVEISIYHSRGIQSILLKDTPIKYLYLPFISKEKFAQGFVIS